jgi:hypothetical protein
VYCDNISATNLLTNYVQHQRTKHVEIDMHFVRDHVALGEARILHVPTSSQFADIFTKGLPTTVFQDFRTSLSSPVSTGGCCIRIRIGLWFALPLLLSSIYTCTLW